MSEVAKPIAPKLQTSEEQTKNEYVSQLFQKMEYTSLNHDNSLSI